MSTKIASLLNSTIQDETISFTDEHGTYVVAYVVASDAGQTIANAEIDGRSVALEIVDFGDGEAEYHEHREGDTFDADFVGSHVVRRTDSAGSLAWERTDA